MSCQNCAPTRGLNITRLNESRYLSEKAIEAANRHREDLGLSLMLGWMTAEILTLREQMRKVKC